MMCRSAWVNGRECTSQGELSRALKLKRLPFTANTRAKPRKNTCLCPVDIKRAAKLAGYQIEELAESDERGFVGDFIFTSEPTNDH